MQCGRDEDSARAQSVSHAETRFGNESALGALGTSAGTMNRQLARSHLEKREQRSPSWQNARYLRNNRGHSSVACRQSCANLVT